jgi:paraquat-inducible protein B
VEYDMSEAQGRDQSQRTQAVTKKSRWPGWIWAVPIAAAAITGWLLLREFTSSGVDVAVTFEEAAGMKPKDTKVLYHGLEVGSVSSVALSQDRKHVVAQVDIDDDEKGALNAGTRFYLEGATPSLSDLSSLKSILSGPTIEIVPGEGPSQRQFTGLVGAPRSALRAAVPYLVNFDDAVGGLKAGAAVTMRGFTVGVIDHVQLATDPQNGTISAPVILLLDPTRFNLAGAAPADGNWGPVMNAALSQLIAHGLRARLDQKPPLIGTPRVVLDMTGDTGGSLRSVGQYPEIPAAGSGGIEALVSQAGQLPLAEIGNNVEAIATRIKTLASSPKLTDSIDHLDRSLTELDATLRDAGPKIAPTIQSARQTIDGLRKTASEIDSTAEAVKSMTGASPAAPNGNLQQALAELTQTGRAVRSLADYLDQHPEALLKGR